MSDTELILKALLRVLEGQRKLAEFYDFLPEVVDGVPQTVRGGAEATPWIKSIHTLVDNENGRHETKTNECVYEEVKIPDRRFASGFRTEKKFAGTRVVVGCRYDTLEELIRDRLEKK